MNFISYEDNFDKLKIGDEIHYFNGSCHFKWKLKHKLSDGFAGKDFASERVFKRNIAFCNIEDNYIKRNTNIWQKFLLYMSKKTMKK